MEKEVLEVVMKRLDSESRVAAILDFQSVPALPKGENYHSTIFRVTLKVVLGNGRQAKKSFIMKQMITEGTREKQQRMAFAKETQVYSVILKQMSYLMEEFEDTDETLWCNCIHSDPYLSCILLEDLKASGYSLVPRQQGLDLDHSIVALRGLGKYHGMAKVLEERGIISKDEYTQKSPFTILKVIKAIPYAGILNLAKAMRESWGPEWEETAKSMMISLDPFAAKLNQVFKTDENEFAVLIHGDCWSNNMMFKYDFQKRPIAVKFFDFQGPQYITPCTDITYFLYLGTQPAVRRSNYQLLLKTYHDSLVRTLDKFGFTGTKPTLEEITATMSRLEFYGLMLFVAAYPGLTGSKNQEAFDFEKLMKTDGEEGFEQEVLKEPGIIEKMGPDIIYYVEKHLKNL
ncbi:unnamed protein product [Nezara viridula]|uniref:CHK kinase-like domain-containing protein n=1 Tax=Nezara viridula TaxID=85310 RepID=A0A9P0MTP8_NEZVI|nr:unnamed protein product [Nezara viridula]